MKQNDAVYQAMVSVVGKWEGKCEPTDEQRAQSYLILFEGFKAGKIDLKRDFDEEYVRKYIPGLVSNHLRKDGRLNGGVKHEVKNPGSRAGSKDPQVAAMRLLLSTVSDPSEQAEIKAHIAKRLAEIKPATEKQLTAEQVETLRAAGLERFIK